MRLEEALKIEQFESPSKRAIVNVLYTGYWLTDQVNELLKPFGISEPQLNVLRILSGQKNRSLNLCDILERMMHKMSNATRLVEKLRLKGLVTREIREDNRRMVEINITNKGLKLLEKINGVLSDYHCEFQNRLTQKECTQLADLLDKLRG
jgi:DNA-binding MarR family transcriptional regulator